MKEPMKQHGAFSWLELVTTDVEDAKRFYTKLFGWTTEGVAMWGMEYTVVKVGEEDAGGIMAMPKQAAGAPPHWGVYVTVDDVYATAKLAVQMGARIIVPPKDIPDVGRFCLFQDPQGAFLSVITYFHPWSGNEISLDGFTSRRLTRNRAKMTAQIADSFLYRGELCADLLRGVGTIKNASDAQIGGLPVRIRRVGLQEECLQRALRQRKRNERYPRCLFIGHRDGVKGYWILLEFWGGTDGSLVFCLDVPLKEGNMQLKPGDKAPAFDLPDQDEKKVSLSDFRGCKVLLYFYPKAGTSGWTTQATSLRDAGKHLKELNVAVVGISPDKPAAQKKFAENNSLSFPLLADPDHKVAESYGVWGEKTMYGKKVQGIIRSSFLIDEKGKITAAWYKIKPEATVPEALKILEG